MNWITLDMPTLYVFFLYIMKLWYIHRASIKCPLTMCGQVQILIISNYFHSIRTLLFGKFWMMTSFSLRCSRELMANHIPSVMFYIKLESPYTVIQVGVCVHVCAAHYLVFIFIMVTVYISIIFRFIVYSIIIFLATGNICSVLRLIDFQVGNHTLYFCTIVIHNREFVETLSRIVM